ncbi:N-6 DNA methylase [Yersinia massiliensis]|uniref:N-6 DNA methylase n=1 Tax=Yersinia massiliensis TaxID=419257 RepID=UPI001CFE88A9|nr:N-6 DNA methylase [Yersinia massiliensis]MCB5319959.1 N-6 DNA methylase [Yersinia massiliensis]
MNIHNAEILGNSLNLGHLFSRSPLQNLFDPSNRRPGVSAAQYRKEFVSIFKHLAPHHHRFDVFRDFVHAAAIAIQNAFLKSDELEQEYFVIERRLGKENMSQLSQLLGCVIGALDAEPSDFLGSLYMELELSASSLGQFFTPYSLSEMMAALTMSDAVQNLNKRPFITYNEPACGAGGMAIAAAMYMRENGYNPQEQIFMVCTDIDGMVADMCYIQLSLLGIPAQVITGNTLTLTVNRTFHTPFWYLGGWEEKLKHAEAVERMMTIFSRLQAA